MLPGFSWWGSVARRLKLFFIRKKHDSETQCYSVHLHFYYAKWISTPFSFASLKEDYEKIQSGLWSGLRRSNAHQNGCLPSEKDISVLVLYIQRMTLCSMKLLNKAFSILRIIKQLHISGSGNSFNPTPSFLGTKTQSLLGLCSYLISCSSSSLIKHH